MRKVGDLREFRFRIDRFVDAYPSLRGPLYSLVQHEKQTTRMSELLQCVAHWVRLTEEEGAPPVRGRRVRVGIGSRRNRGYFEALCRAQKEFRCVWEEVEELCRTADGVQKFRSEN